MGQFLGYPTLHIYIANPPKPSTSAFFCIHKSIYSYYDPYQVPKIGFGLKSSHLKIGANGAGAYTIPRSVSHEKSAFDKVCVPQANWHTEGTKDVPSGKGGWHRPVILEYARPWNMRCRSPPNLISRAM